MAKTNNLKDYLTDLADTIRSKKGKTEPINAQNFSDEIASIQTGIIPEGTLNITENGTYDVTEIAEVNVDVPSQIETTDLEILQAISNTNMVLGIEPVWTEDEINTILTEYSGYRNLILGLGG